MLRIRLQRVGKRKQPSYRVVVVDSRAPRNGRTVEIIGHYNPLTDPPAVVLDREKVLQWLAKGAQPSEAAAKVLARHSAIERPATTS